MDLNGVLAQVGSRALLQKNKNKTKSAPTKSKNHIAMPAPPPEVRINEQGPAHGFAGLGLGGAMNGGGMIGGGLPPGYGPLQMAYLQGTREGALQAMHAQAPPVKDFKSYKGSTKDSVSVNDTKPSVPTLKRANSDSKPSKGESTPVAVALTHDGGSHSHGGAEAVDTGAGNVVQVQYAYAMEDLDDEWRGVLEDLDKRLQQADHSPMNARERAVAIKYLLVATGSKGADTAKESAAEEIIRYRRFHKR